MSESELYRTVESVDAYFSDQLYATDWTGASAADKELALRAATRAIDSLKYRGVKRSLFDAMVADGGDATLSGDELYRETDLTGKEIAAANALQIKQFPRDDADDPESWTLTIDATGGTFTLTLNGEETGALAFDDDAATIQTALEALASILSGDVTVTGSGPFTITMGGDYASTFYNSLSSDPSSLTGGGTSADVVVVEDNVPDDIFWAVCEEAKNLLSGRDPEQEFRNLPLTSDGVGSNRVSMDRSQMPPLHQSHFITSPLAWKYLQRYLAVSNSFSTKRV